MFKSIKHPFSRLPQDKKYKLSETYTSDSHSQSSTVKVLSYHQKSFQMLHSAAVQIINHVRIKSQFWENCKNQFQCLHLNFNLI